MPLKKEIPKKDPALAAGASLRRPPFDRSDVWSLYELTETYRAQSGGHRYTAAIQILG